MENKNQNNTMENKNQNNTMKNKIFLLIIFIGSTMFLSSCASVFSGTSDKITFKSEPPDATVYLDGAEIGKTNNDIEVKRKFKSVRKVVYKKDGYQDLAFNFYQKAVLSYYIGCFVLPIVSPLIDIISGAALQPRDKYFEKTLQSVQQQNAPSTKSKADRLKELKQMLDDKLITQDEYNNEKKKILDE